MNWPTHPAYKSSGVQWLGKVPAHWGLSPMFTVGHERTLPNTGLSETNLLSLSYGRIVRKDIDTTDGLLPASFDTYQIVEPCDIVFRFTDLQNDKHSLRSALVPERGIITSAYMAFSPTQIDPIYFSYLMRSYDLTKVFYSRGGGLRQSLKYEDVKRLPILVPPTDEQRIISRFLARETAKIDALIDKQQQLIATLREDRAATITQAVTKGLDPHVELRDSGVEWMGTVPSHWRVRQIKWGSPVKRGASPRPIDDPKYFDDEGEWSWVRIADVSSSAGRLHETTQRLSELGSSLSVKLQPGSLFVSIAGTVGKPCITEIQACIHDGFVYFPTLDIEPEYLYRIFEAGECYKGLGKMGTQLNLNTDTIGSIHIPIPQREEQQAILSDLDDRCEKIDALIAKSTGMIATLREYRSALITNAVTGKIDVREAV